MPGPYDFEVPTIKSALAATVLILCGVYVVCLYGSSFGL